jgi:uncharacterized membrane protein YraQ (UPF0718 family)
MKPIVQPVINGIAVTLLVGLVLVANAVPLPGVDALAPRAQALVTIFLGIVIEALPFLLAGVLVSSAIHLFVSTETIQRLSPRSPWGAAALGALLGLAFPVCECGSIPTARRLLDRGAPAALGIAFVLAAPVVNPIVIVSTWVAFSGDPLIVGGRIVLTIIIAMLIGVVVGRAGSACRSPAASAALHHDHHHDHDHAHDRAAGWGTRIRAVLDHSADEVFEMGRYLIIGAMIAATLQVAIPRAALLAIGGDAFGGTFALMVLAMVLSICSTVDAFVALSFVGTFSSGAILAFLVFGPMIDIKALLMLTTTFNRATVARMAVGAALLSAAAGIAISLLTGGPA